jgi:ferritin-like metal-binding protein YciE
MAKAKSKNKENAKSNTAFTKKTNDQPIPAEDNPSKLHPTPEADIDVMELDASDGLIKLLVDSLKDAYWAENHLIMALPKMAKASTLPALQDAILNHLDQTKTHAKKLEQVFEITDTGTPARNLAIIMASQKVEHYEISSYTGLIKLADSLDYPEVSGVLEEILNEEEDSDALLSEIAGGQILNSGEEESENEE